MRNSVFVVEICLDYLYYAFFQAQAIEKKRWIMKRSSFQLLLALFVMALLFSCGGSGSDQDDDGKSGDKEKATAALEKPRNDTESSRATALEAEARVGFIPELV